ncbi:flagellar hook-length control protein FliK [Bacillus sp. es.036]|uniref:flagellar hook-length control protein FliK n=1 Tax=Bacillus sp. es.036 TaxID=1761764 RepID=UPI000BF90E85|nr:flagellar hook-length control protein FliK [Bacillus sp. es.036]PFG15274.1 flagellar hook-length control protein FliK [Bacillus sp. es.036]
MNAIQSLGKSVIVQPKPTANSTNFSTLLSALGVKVNEQEAGKDQGTAGERALEQGDGKIPYGEAELPLNLQMINNGAHPLDIQGSQASSSPKLQGYLESSENVQVKSGSQQGFILTVFTNQKLMDMEQFGNQQPLESVVSKVNESSLQLQGKNGLEILPEFSKQEWLKVQGAKEVLANPKPLEEVKMIEVAKGQEATKSLEIIKQLTAEQSSHQKNLDVTVDQTPQLEKQEPIVEDEQQRPVLEEGEKARPQVDQTETEQLDNLEQTATETLGDDVQLDEKPDGLPLVKQSETLVKEAPVQARYLNTELSEMITERMQLSKNGDETNIRIKLSPENLGQLDIRLTTSDGKVTAHIVTATAGAKELIESQLHQLRHTLVQQGIQLDKVEVVQQSSTDTFMQDGRGEQGQFQQGKRRHDRKGEYELEDNPLVTNEREESTSGGINYAI